MRNIAGIFFLNLTFFLFIFLWSPSGVIAQLSETVSAVVIAERDFLRVQPSLTAASQNVVLKGAKLKVVPSAIAKGWYLAYLEEAPSVGGYIHGNSIKLVKSQAINTTKKKVVPKKNSTVVPKTIILDDTDVKDLNEKKTKTQSSKVKSITKQASTRSNYCPPPLYCPDIDEVHVALLDNTDKFQKGKFEKTADWEKRKPTILREVKLIGGKTTAEKMYFLYEQGTLTQGLNEPDYDADKELWTFPLIFRESANETCIPIISQSTGQVLCLIVPKRLGTEINATVSMPPATAAVNEKKLQIVFVGKIIEPYLWNNNYSSIRGVLSGIHFELEEIICLNPQTGQRWKVNIPSKIEIPPKKIPNELTNEVNLSEDEALAQFRRTLVADPMNAQAYLGMGKIYSSRGEYDKAISELKTATYMNAQLIDAHIELGRIYFIKKDCQQAEYYSKKALEIDSQNQFAQGLKRLVEKCSVDNVITNTESKIGENHNLDTAAEKNTTFEGIWEMKIVIQNESLPVNLTITKNGRKYKGIITDNREASKKFDVAFDGRNFQFRTSTKVNFQKVTIDSRGYFEGNLIKADMTVIINGKSVIGSFNGTRLN